MKLSLFPKNEEWGTGDEALDLRLTNSLKKAAELLSLEAVFDFYSFGSSLKTRTFNPAFQITIEQVSKALLFHLNPKECTDELFKKMRGRYFYKERMEFCWSHFNEITSELKSKKHYRYKTLIDFSLKLQTAHERNPFTSEIIHRHSHPLTAKIIFKEFRQFLSGEKLSVIYDDEFSMGIKSGKVLVVENLGEFWFSDSEIFCLSKIAL